VRSLTAHPGARIAAPVLVGLMSLLNGCSSPQAATTTVADSPGVPPWEEEAGPVMGPAVPWSEEQRTAMADGTVTSEEYHEAFRRYAACLTAKGVEVTAEDRGDRIDAAVSGGDAYCYEREFRGVDMLWQLTHEDPAVTERYRSCLIQLGLDVPDTQDEMLQVLDGLNIEPYSCSEYPPLGPPEPPGNDTGS